MLHLCLKSLINLRRMSDNNYKILYSQVMKTINIGLMSDEFSKIFVLKSLSLLNAERITEELDMARGSKVANVCILLAKDSQRVTTAPRRQTVALILPFNIHAAPIWKRKDRHLDLYECQSDLFADTHIWERRILVEFQMALSNVSIVNCLI